MQYDTSFSDRLTEKQPAPTGTMAWIGFGCCLFALACLSISFCSPYWVQTWPMSENKFRNMGLWHVCFFNYMQFKDDSQQVYSGCWWVFNKQPKYYKLREWLTPPWFITCQVLVTGCLMIEIATVLVVALVFLHVCPLLNHEYLQTYGIFTAASLMFLVSMISFVVGVLFGVQVNDRYWMPRPDQNFLSWGFGFLIISAIFAMFAGTCLFKAGWGTYTILLRKEDDFTKAALEMSMHPTLPGDQTPVLVAPGVSAAVQVQPIFPPRYSPQELNQDSIQKPALVEEQPTVSTTTFDGWTKKTPPAATDTCGQDGATFKSATSFDQPEYSTYSQDADKLRDSGGTFNSDMTFPQKPAAFGKSYDRHFSDTSFNDEELESFVPKVERQY